MIKIGQIGIGHNHAAGKMETVRALPELFEVIGYAEENEEWVEKRGNRDCYKDLPRLTVEELIEKCDAYHPNHYVFHSKAGKKEEGLLELRKPALVRSFNEMVRTANGNVCMENMVGSFPTTTAEMLEILQQVEGGKCCVDMNHFLQEKPEDAILTLGNHIATIHVSDHDGTYEKHWLPKQGVNDWMKIIGALEKIGYQGMFTYEAEVEKYGYTYAEVRRNYEELFEEYNKLASR